LLSKLKMMHFGWCRCDFVASSSYRRMFIPPTEWKRRKQRKIFHEECLHSEKCFFSESENLKLNKMDAEANALQMWVIHFNFLRFCVFVFFAFFASVINVSVRLTLGKEIRKIKIRKWLGKKKISKDQNVNHLKHFFMFL